MAIRDVSKHSKRIGVSAWTRWEELYVFQKERVVQSMPKKERLKRVRKTVNLTKKDDSLISIAYHTYKIISKCHPDRHQVLITYMEWQFPKKEDQKLAALRVLFAHYDPVWYVGLEQKGSDLVEAKFTFPGMDWLAFG